MLGCEIPVTPFKIMLLYYYSSLCVSAKCMIVTEARVTYLQSPLCFLSSLIILSFDAEVGLVLLAVLALVYSFAGQAVVFTAH